LRQAERREPPWTREPDARHLQFRRRRRVRIRESKRTREGYAGARERGGGIERDAYKVGGGGAEAEPPRDAEQEVLPEEERGLGPVTALPSEGLEPGAEVGAVGVVPPADPTHLRPHRRLPPLPVPLAGSHGSRAGAAAAVGSPGSATNCRRGGTN
jgi:hypothetical protein